MNVEGQGHRSEFKVTGEKRAQQLLKWPTMVDCYMPDALLITQTTAPRHALGYFSVIYLNSMRCEEYDSYINSVLK